MNFEVSNFFKKRTAYFKFNHVNKPFHGENSKKKVKITVKKKLKKVIILRIF